MQTFLPYSDFKKTAQVLDKARLFKQLVEAQQLINMITHGKTKRGKKYKGFINHPARKMWLGYPEALKEYFNIILDEVRARGIKTKLRKYKLDKIIYPTWLGNRKFHASHRAALLAKNPDHYQQFKWQEKAQIDYIWPTNSKN